MKSSEFHKTIEFVNYVKSLDKMDNIWDVFVVLREEELWNELIVIKWILVLILFIRNIMISVKIKEIKSRNIRKMMIVNFIMIFWLHKKMIVI